MHIKITLRLKEEFFQNEIPTLESIKTYKSNDNEFLLLDPFRIISPIQ